MKSITLTTILLIFSLTGYAAPIIEVIGSISHDFGSFTSSVKQSTQFTIKNTGDEPLKIKQIRKTCGCSEVSIDTKVIEPDATAVITAGIKANSLSGKFSKSFYLITNATNRILQRFTMTGTAATEHAP